jgi:hypothetical protein
MVKYIIEGGINFYEELYKSFDEEETDANAEDKSNNLCQITGIPLTDNFVTMECNHKFNYTALYKDIYNQKFIFKSYTCSTLSDTDKEKFKGAKTDYFIKCPYCRNIQFTLLPYYPEMIGIEKRYGINSLEKTESDNYYAIKLTENNYSYSVYGYTFKYGNCCKVLGNVDGKDILCGSKISAPVPEMNKSFCSAHIRAEVKQYKLEKIKKAKEIAKKQKEDEKAAIKKQKEDEKALKKDEKKVKKVKNVVTSQTIEIPTFEPATASNLCQTILKSGPRKGQLCGNKSLKNVSGCCSRHKDLLPNPENNNI